MKTTNYKLLIAVGYLIVICANLSARQIPVEHSVYGMIKDNARSPLPWATVSIINTDGKMIIRNSTDSVGHFSFQQIPSGSYTLQVEKLGYGTKVIPIRLIAASSKNYQMQTIYLQETSRQLTQVEISESPLLIKQGIDQLEYNVQADPDSKGNNLLYIMRKVPYVTVDGNDNILLNANSSFRIFINGKPSGLTEKNPVSVLRSMPASTIEKIILITNPSAKYDAEGMAGIIDIILVKNIVNGYKGTLNLSEELPANGPTLGGTLLVKRNKTMASFFAGSSYRHIPETNNSLLRHTGGAYHSFLDQAGNQKSTSRTSYIGADLSYEINQVQLVSAQVNLYGSHDEEESYLHSKLQGADSVLQQYELSNHHKNNVDNIDLSVNYQLGFFRKKGRILTMSYRYALYNSDGNHRLKTTEIIRSPFSDLQQINHARAEEHSMQIDYADKFQSFQFETGGKGILRRNNSLSNYVSNETITDNFLLDQDVYALYSTLAFTGKNWGIKGGIRAEKTLVRAKVDHDYLHIVPSFAFGFDLSEKTKLNFGFNRRLRRPGISRLNPFIDRSNPNYQISGNPYLRPASINNLNLGFNRNGKFTINANIAYALFNDLDFRIYTFNPESQNTISTIENTGNGAAFIAGLNLQRDINKKLNISFNGNITHINLKNENDMIPATKGWFYSTSLAANYRMAATWNISGNIQITGRQPASKSFQSFNQAQINSGLSMSRQLVKEKLDLSFSVNNPFRKFRSIQTTVKGLDFYEVQQNQFYFRSFRFSLNYYFGKLKEDLKKTKKSIHNDDISN